MGFSVGVLGWQCLGDLDFRSHGSDESWLLGDMAGEVTQQVQR